MVHVVTQNSDHLLGHAQLPPQPPHQATAAGEQRHQEEQPRPEHGRFPAMVAENRGTPTQPGGDEENTEHPASPTTPATKSEAIAESPPGLACSPGGLDWAGAAAGPGDACFPLWDFRFYSFSFLGLSFLIVFL